MRTLLIFCVMGLIVLSMPSFAQHKKDTPNDNPAALAIDKDEKIQEARKLYLEEEGDAKRAARFYDLATLLGKAVPKNPVPEGAVLRYLGKPDFVGYTGEKDAKGEWVKKNTVFAYVVDNKGNGAVPKSVAGAIITVFANLRDGQLTGVGFNDGAIKESKGFWEKYSESKFDPKKIPQRDNK